MITDSINLFKILLNIFLESTNNGFIFFPDPLPELVYMYPISTGACLYLGH